MPYRFRRIGLPVLMIASAVLAAGCGGSGGRSPGVLEAAASFERSLAARDAAATCAALAPGTRSELESSEKAPCNEVIAEEDLPLGGAARRVDVYGNQARVVLDADTLFLSRFPEGWEVVAAGCRPERGRPYQCEIKGG